MEQGSNALPERSHAIRPHTADVIIEAHGRTRAVCLAEAVAALAEVYADCPAEGDCGPRERVPVEIDAADALGQVLEETLLLLDARGLVCVGAELDDTGDRLTGDLLAVDVAAVEVTGSVPKGIAGAVLEHSGGPSDGWQARAIIDV